MGRRAAGAVAVIVLAGVGLSPPAVAAPHTPKRCALPGAGQGFRTASPASQDLKAGAVRKALAFAATRNRLSVKIFRRGCLVGAGPTDPVTERVPFNVFSSTKSVVSLSAGIAQAEGKLDLDDPIGRYLPAGIGDAAHRAITIRQLLTETSGLKQSILTEFGSLGVEPNVVKQAMALPLEHRPGTFFSYSQRTPDVVAYVVQRAVGEDFQAYTQRKLFDRVGIRRDSYFWLRDRAGNTYGYANLFIAPRAFARIGLLLGNGGVWRGKRVVPRGYLRAIQKPTATNPCYSMLFWVNSGGDSCVTASIPSRRVLRHNLVPSAPKDLYATVGAFQQNNFVIPSLDLVVTWTGLGGDAGLDPQAILSANPGGDLYHEFFRILMRGVRDKAVKDPGPYPDDGPNLDLDPMNYADPTVLLGGLGVGPYAPANCNVLFCSGDDLTTGPAKELPDVIRAIRGLLAPVAR